MESTETNLDNVPTATHQSTISSTIQAIVELTQHYQDSTHKYSQQIQQYNLEIEKLKLTINEAIADKQEDEDIFSKHASEVKYYARLVGESNDTFHKDVDTLEELEHEYKKSMKASDFKQIVQTKKRALKKLQQKIDEQEEELLAQELERLNILEKLTTKRKYVDTLQHKLKIVELEKTHYEATKLQQVITLPTLGTTEVREEVIDIDTVDEA